MNYSEVTKVVELQSQNEVNKYLDLGWKLLEIYKTTYDTCGPGANHQTAHFVLGWTGGEPKYPEQDAPKYGMIL